MAGTIIADKIQTENSFLTLNVGQTLVATINSSGILNSSGGIMVGANGSVSNTAIAGVITGSQLASPLALTGNLNFDSTGTTGVRSPAANTLSFHTAGTEDMRIDSAGNVGIGTSSPLDKLDVRGGAIRLGDDSVLAWGASGYANYIAGNTASNFVRILTNGTERMRLDSAGRALFGTTNGNPGGTAGSGGISLGGNSDGNYYAGVIQASSLGNASLILNRSSDDGNIVVFKAQENTEGTISVSGTTVSYNGGHLARYSQLPTGARDVSILKGTVMSNLDAMCEWLKDGEPTPNEQLNKMKVSDVEGDKNVAGVFVNWDNDDKDNTFDMNIAMTGDMIIRIAEGVTVQKGDLLMSAGDGTAKPQSDDIVRSKTIAKVTSNHVTCTYEDGSYCVPCVLMAC
jgi:hypothetical protein